MRIEYCKYMLEIYRTGSIYRAAENSFTSSQNISRVKNKIEKKFNIKIFNRQNNIMESTDEGYIFLEFCNKALGEYVGMQNKIERRQHDKEVSGVIYIYAAYFITKFFLNDVILEFKKLYPNVSFRIVNDYISNNCRCLNGKKEGIGIFVNNDITGCDNLNNEKILDVKFGIAVGSSHPLADRSYITIDDIKETDSTVLLLLSEDINQKDLYNVFEFAKNKDVKLDFVSSYELFLDYIRNNIGVGIVCKELNILNSMNRNNIKVLDLKGYDRICDLCLFYEHQNEEVKEVEKLFVSFLKRNIRTILYNKNLMQRLQ